MLSREPQAPRSQHAFWPCPRSPVRQAVGTRVPSGFQPKDLQIRLGPLGLAKGLEHVTGEELESPFAKPGGVFDLTLPQNALRCVCFIQKAKDNGWPKPPCGSFRISERLNPGAQSSIKTMRVHSTIVFRSGLSSKLGQPCF